jgi:hypothetical protein
MMDINEIRHMNVRALIRKMEEAEGKTGDRAGGLTMLAAKLDKSTGQVAHFASDKPIKKIGDQIAREIEVALGLERGWMDWLHSDDGAAVQSQSHPLRLNPVMLSEVHRVLRELSTDAGKSFDIERESDAVRFLQVLDLRTKMQAKPSKEEWTRYGMRLARIMATQGAASDGRGDSVPTQGTGKGRVAGGVRGKA